MSSCKVISVVWALVLIAMTLWAFIIGTMSVSVQRDTTLLDVKYRYQLITINNDGSYRGKDIQGVPISGCIQEQICNVKIR